MPNTVSWAYGAHAGHSRILTTMQRGHPASVPTRSVPTGQQKPWESQCSPLAPASACLSALPTARSAQCKGSHSGPQGMSTLNRSSFPWKRNQDRKTDISNKHANPSLEGLFFSISLQKCVSPRSLLSMDTRAPGWLR